MPGIYIAKEAFSLFSLFKIQFLKGVIMQGQSENDTETHSLLAVSVQGPKRWRGVTGR